jgi:hypothetical protein
MVYASTSLALAAIELFVHLEPNLEPDDLVAIAATLPKGEPGRRLEPETLPVQWWSDDFAPSRAIGDAWIRERSSLAIEVPSAALRLDWNVLVNPTHPAMATLTTDEPQPFHFDARMFRRQAPEKESRIGARRRHLRLEVELNGIDERDQPLEQRLVHGMRGVGIGGGFFGEGHEAAKRVSLATRREIVAHMHIDEAWDVATEGEDVVGGADFVGVCGLWFPAKSKDVDEHSSSED